MGIMIVSSYEKLRATIESSKPTSEDYTIDLASYAGNGCCTCRDFECARWPAIRDGATPGEATRCKHIKYLRNQLAGGCIAIMHEDYKDRAFDLLEFTVIAPEGTFIVNLLECDGKGSCQCSLFKEVGHCEDIEACRDDLASRVIKEFIRLYPSKED